MPHSCSIEARTIGFFSIFIHVIFLCSVCMSLYLFHDFTAKNDAQNPNFYRCIVSLVYFQSILFSSTLDLRFSYVFLLIDCFAVLSMN